jgi:hypothetical protein
MRLWPNGIFQGRREEGDRESASEHERLTRGFELEASREPIPKWVLAILIGVGILTILWAYWLIMLAF